MRRDITKDTTSKIFEFLGADKHGTVSTQTLTRFIKLMSEQDKDGGDAVANELLVELDKDPDGSMGIGQVETIFDDLGEDGMISNSAMLTFLSTQNSDDTSPVVQQLLTELKAYPDETLSISDFKRLFGEVGADESVSKQEMQRFARHVSRLSQLFELFDTNGTEKAYSRDISKFVRRMLDSPDIESKAVVKELLAALDKDPDGSLSLEEFQKLFRELGDQDAAKKDQIERFVQQMHDYKNSKAESVSNALLARLDNRSDESISINEFKKVFHEISVEIFCASVSTTNSTNPSQQRPGIQK